MDGCREGWMDVGKDGWKEGGMKKGGMVNRKEGVGREIGRVGHEDGGEPGMG